MQISAGRVSLHALDEVKTIFRQHSKDHVDSISPDELLQVMQTVSGTDWKKEQIEILLQASGIARDGHVFLASEFLDWLFSAEDLSSLMVPPRANNSSQESLGPLQVSFVSGERIDADLGGAISVEQIRSRIASKLQTTATRVRLLYKDRLLADEDAVPVGEITAVHVEEQVSDLEARLAELPSPVPWGPDDNNQKYLRHVPGIAAGDPFVLQSLWLLSMIAHGNAADLPKCRSFETADLCNISLKEVTDGVPLVPLNMPHTAVIGGLQALLDHSEGLSAHVAQLEAYYDVERHKQLLRWVLNEEKVSQKERDAAESWPRCLQEVMGPGEDDEGECVDGEDEPEDDIQVIGPIDKLRLVLGSVKFLLSNGDGSDFTLLSQHEANARQLDHWVQLLKIASGRPSPELEFWA